MKNFIVGFIFVVIMGFLFVNMVSNHSNLGDYLTSLDTTSNTSIFYPEPTNYVVDSADVLSQETEDSLNARLKEFDSTAQIAVVTVKTTQPLDEKQYAINLADKWKVGHKDVDNGIIFLVVTQDRRVRIEVGRGLEGKITDAKAGQILDKYAVPYLKNNDWENGIKSTVSAIILELKGGEN